MNKTAIETHVEEVTVQAGGLLRSKYGLWALGGISFLESALLVPIITDPFLVAYILADKKSVYKGVLVTLLGSILGGVFAYAIAFLFYEFIADRYLVGVVGGTVLCDCGTVERRNLYNHPPWGCHTPFHTH